ncbi:hypothetical protein ILFOPFJJ_06439 [Ensifer psoraleae]|uniref:hypothetical protein n=1 Tax=Sinorhizobium psoraleae TaxID=520838 RepID=UPI001568609E|nr:hypothetical protein [Sinorhizobium psoraleae]NRP75516.1 hypothetical protein [Sinorhizobium psoraleae]
MTKPAIDEQQRSDRTLGIGNVVAVSAVEADQGRPGLRIGRPNGCQFSCRKLGRAVIGAARELNCTSEPWRHEARGSSLQKRYGMFFT